VTGSKYVVCHFYHKDFERCKIVDMHLRNIARQHAEAKFIYLDAEKTPFFVQKLQIKTLPTIILFIDGIAADRIVGFGDLGNKDDFPTMALTRRLIKSGVIQAKTKEEQGRVKIRRGKGDSDSDRDEDEY
jgi:thioredoxin-like negative regulator of GroEL